jgi:hypothetical protein
MKSTKKKAKKQIAVTRVKLPDGERHVARVRKLCLALPETTEKISHGEPTFFVRERVFCMCSDNHHNDGHIAAWIPAAPGLQAELLKEAREKYFYPPYVGKGGWIGIELPRVTDDELGGHISDAWRLIEAKQKKARRSK